MLKCNKCDNNISKTEDASTVRCSKCGLYSHIACAALRAKPRDAVNWKCAQCKLIPPNKKTQESAAVSPSAVLSPAGSDRIVNDIKDLRCEMDSIKKDLLNSNAAEAHQSDLEERIAAAEAKLIKLENISDIITSLQERVSALEEKNQYLEQAERISHLELHGLTEHVAENLVSVVVQTGKVAGVSIAESDLKWVGRVGPTTEASLKPRPVLVKFAQHDVKNDLLRAVRKRRGIKLQELGYAGDNHNVFVSENLTKYYRDIFREARKLENYQFTWTSNCRIYVRKDKDSKPILIKSKNQLNSL